MDDLMASKSWTIETVYGPDGQLRFDLADHALSVGAGTSPVEQLLAAVGSCFAQSCSAIMHHHGLPPGPVTVLVRGHKPAGPLRGKGLDRIEIDLRFDQPLDASKSRRVLADTKAFCTVTNTLSKDIAVVVSDVTAAPRA